MFLFKNLAREELVMTCMLAIYSPALDVCERPYQYGVTHHCKRLLFQPLGWKAYRPSTLAQHCDETECIQSAHQTCDTLCLSSAGRVLK